jgi:hypothetical protein
MRVYRTAIRVGKNTDPREEAPGCHYKQHSGKQVSNQFFTDPDLRANGATIAAAVVVSFESNIQDGEEHDESHQQRKHRGKAFRLFHDLISFP